MKNRQNGLRLNQCNNEIKRWCCKMKRLKVERDTHTKFSWRFYIVIDFRLFRTMFWEHSSLKKHALSFNDLVTMWWNWNKNSLALFLSDLMFFFCSAEITTYSMYITELLWNMWLAQSRAVYRRYASNNQKYESNWFQSFTSNNFSLHGECYETSNTDGFSTAIELLCVPSSLSLSFCFIPRFSVSFLTSHFS